MLDGISVMFEVALAIVRKLQSQIMKIKDSTDLISFIRKSSSQLSDPAALKDKVVYFIIHQLFAHTNDAYCYYSG